MHDQELRSCIYEGQVRHRRVGPVANTFTYGIYMMYLDLDELPGLFDRYRLWSARGPAPAWFRRRDHLGDPSRPLDLAVRDLVGEYTGRRPDGPVRLLTHLRYFGYCFNPASFYYCFDQAGERVETIVAEVTNTPWGESYHYICDRDANVGTPAKQRYLLKKSFFVSPFMDMDVDYDWRFLAPGKRLIVHMENRKQDGKYFDATLTLTRRELSSANLGRVLTRYPLMTAQVIGGIYWQALKLMLKGCKTFVHPRPPAAAGELVRAPVTSEVTQS